MWKPYAMSLVYYIRIQKRHNKELKGIATVTKSPEYFQGRSSLVRNSELCEGAAALGFTCGLWRP